MNLHTSCSCTPCVHSFTALCRAFFFFFLCVKQSAWADWSLSRKEFVLINICIAICTNDPTGYVILCQRKC